MDRFAPSPNSGTLNDVIPQSGINGHFAVNVFDNLPVAVYTCDHLGYIQSYNKAAAKLWGREPVIGKDLWCGSWKIFEPNGEPMQLDSCPMARTLREKKAVEGEEIIVQRPDGSKRNVLPYPVPTFDSSGALTGAINTLVDITDQRMDDARQSMLAAIIESSDDAIISKTLDGIITSWNEAAEKMFGYTPDEAIGRHITLIIPPERLSEENVIISKIRNSEKLDHFETFRLAKNGELLPISLTVSPIKDANGRVIGASKIARNISIQKSAEKALQQYTQNLETLYSIGELISEDLDIQRILQKVTDETTKLTGAQFGAFFYNTIDNRGESYMLYTLSGAPKEAFEKFGMPRNTAVFNATFSGEGVLRVDDITKDPRYGKNAPNHGMPEGHLPVVSYLAVPVISKTGVVIGGLFFGHPKAGIFKKDHETIVVSIASQAAVALDNAKLYEEIKILNARKDEFIGIASHELKTPLTSINGYLQILERNLANDPNAGFVKKTKTQLNKLLVLVSDLLDVSKIQAGKLDLVLEAFNFHNLLTEAMEIVQLLNVSHELILNSDSEQLPVLADRQRLEQVIINLLTNAIKYSPGAKQVHIDVTRSDKYISVKIKDFGIGIPEEQQEKIFSRFFRADGLAPYMSGLGLGLYISKEIIDRHKGEIGVKSESGKGSEFYFSIPFNGN
ncbi:MAG TPA: PAS domain S-box protein [Mucilaginibacter sp.]|nr:PAS domain S-box protein [Mucilaginibacter sp.]